MKGSLSQAWAKAHSIILQIALIIAWSNSMAKQLARFLWRDVTYRKSSIRPCMKLWKLLCLVIEVSGSRLMLPNTWDPQKEEGRSQKARAALQICVSSNILFLNNNEILNGNYWNVLCFPSRWMTIIFNLCVASITVVYACIMSIIEFNSNYSFSYFFFQQVHGVLERIEI